MVVRCGLDITQKNREQYKHLRCRAEKELRKSVGQKEEHCSVKESVGKEKFINLILHDIFLEAL